MFCSRILCYTLNAGRSHFEKRHVLVVSSVAELRDTLVRLQQGEKPANAFSGTAGQIAAADAAIYRQVQRTALEELKSLDRSKRDEYRERLLVLGGLYIKGYEIDWRTLHQGELCRRVSLPTYPFAQERYWAVAPQSKVTTTVAGFQDGQAAGETASEYSTASGSGVTVRIGDRIAIPMPSSDLAGPAFGWFGNDASRRQSSALR